MSDVVWEVAVPLSRLDTQRVERLKDFYCASTPADAILFAIREESLRFGEDGWPADPEITLDANGDRVLRP